MDQQRVLPQSTSVTEAFDTLTATVWLFTSMAAFMPCQVVSLGESLRAIDAHENTLCELGLNWSKDINIQLTLNMILFYMGICSSN